VEYAETAYWLALLCAEDLDRAVAKRELYRLTIVEHHLLSELAGRTVTELAGLLPGLSESEAARWASALAAVASASDELGAQRLHGVDLITRADPVYPENLAERLPEQKLPYLLFYRGNLALLDRPAVYVAGAEAPQSSAALLAHALAEVLAPLPLACVGGYTQGVDRTALSDADAAGGATMLILPVGLDNAGPILRAGQKAVERGDRLELSPYLPSVAYTPALGRARTLLTTMLSDVLVQVDPDMAAGDWPGLQDYIARGCQVLSSRTSETAHASDWLEHGATLFADAHDALALIKQHLDLADDAGGSDEPHTNPDLGPVHFDDAASAISQLERTGRVPERLMRRLRDAERQGNLGSRDWQAAEQSPSSRNQEKQQDES
jgi:predicted Rossmann fold nucleotide-binding protein DprA/Smf involved in DNA uptake